jgi:hypothetical protein
LRINRFFYAVRGVLFEKTGKGRKKWNKSCFAVKNESKAWIFGAGIEYDAMDDFFY